MNVESLNTLEELFLKVGRIKAVADMLFQAHSELDADPFSGMRAETPAAVFSLMVEELDGIEKGIDSITRVERKAKAAAA